MVYETRLSNHKVKNEEWPFSKCKKLKMIQSSTSNKTSNSKKSLLIIYSKGIGIENAKSISSTDGFNSMSTTLESYRTQKQKLVHEKLTYLNLSLYRHWTLYESLFKPKIRHRVVDKIEVEHRKKPRELIQQSV